MNHKEASFLSDILYHVIRQMVLDGTIRAEGKSTEEILNSFYKEAKEYVEYGVETTIDHTKSLFELGENCEKSKKWEMAALYYGIWAEHQINLIITALCTRRKLSENFSQMLIRDTGFKAKFLWIHLFLRKSPPKGISDSLSKLMERRNSIVHYKWKPKAEDHEIGLESSVMKAKVCLRYIESMIDVHLMSNSEEKLTEIRKLLYSKYRGIKKSLRELIRDTEEKPSNTGVRTGHSKRAKTKNGGQPSKRKSPSKSPPKTVQKGIF